MRCSKPTFKKTIKAKKIVAFETFFELPPHSCLYIQSIKLIPHIHKILSSSFLSSFSFFSPKISSHHNLQSIFKQPNEKAITFCENIEFQHLPLKLHIKFISFNYYNLSFLTKTNVKIKDNFNLHFDK